MKNLQPSKPQGSGARLPKLPRPRRGGRDGAQGGRALGRGTRLHDDRAGGLGGVQRGRWGRGWGGEGGPAGTAYRVAALQVAVLVAKGRDVDLHGRAGAAPHSPPGRTVQAAPPPAPLPARARAAGGARPGDRGRRRRRRRRRDGGRGRSGARRGRGVGPAGRRGSAGPGRRGLRTGVCTGGCARPRAGRHPGLSCPAGSGSAGRPPPGTGRPRRTVNDGVARFRPACFGSRSDRGKPCQLSPGLGCCTPRSAKPAEPGDGTA